MRGEMKKGKVLPGERGHLAHYNLYPAMGIGDYPTTTVKSRQGSRATMIHRLGSMHGKAGLGYLLDPWC